MLSFSIERTILNKIGLEARIQLYVKPTKGNSLWASWGHVRGHGFALSEPEDRLLWGVEGDRPSRSVSNMWAICKSPQDCSVMRDL